MTLRHCRAVPLPLLVRDVAPQLEQALTRLRESIVRPERHCSIRLQRRIAPPASRVARFGVRLLADRRRRFRSTSCRTTRGCATGCAPLRASEPNCRDYPRGRNDVLRNRACAVTGRLPWPGSTVLHLSPSKRPDPESGSRRKRDMPMQRFGRRTELPGGAPPVTPHEWMVGRGLNALAIVQFDFEQRVSANEPRRHPAG